MPQRDEDSIAQFPIGKRVLTTDNFRLRIGKNVFMHTLQKSLKQKLFTFRVLLFVREETTLVSYCILIPGSVRGPLKDHAQQTGSQETNHSQQANIFPKILVNHWGTPFKHDFNIIQKTARMEKNI